MGDFLDSAAAFLTGRSSEEESFYLDSNRTNDLVSQLNTIGTSDVESAREEVRSAMSELAAACQYIGSIDVNVFDSLYDSLSQQVSQISNTVEGNAESIRAYSESDPLTRILATKGMLDTKFLEGMSSIFEGMGDGALSLMGGFCGLLGAKDMQDFFGDIVEINITKDAFHNFREATGINKYSMFTEDSGLATAAELAGDIAGFVIPGGAITKIPSLLGKSAKISRMAGDTFVAVESGLGIGTEKGLNAGMSFEDAFKNEGLKEAALQGIFMGTLSKGGQLFNKGRAVLKGSKQVKLAAEDVKLLEGKVATTKAEAKSLVGERQSLKVENANAKKMMQESNVGTKEYKLAEERVHSTNEHLAKNEANIRAKGNEYKQAKSDLEQAKVVKEEAEVNLQQVKEKKLKDFSFENKQPVKEKESVINSKPVRENEIGQQVNKEVTPAIRGEKQVSYNVASSLTNKAGVTGVRQAEKAVNVASKNTGIPVPSQMEKVGATVAENELPKVMGRASTVTGETTNGLSQAAASAGVLEMPKAFRTFEAKAMEGLDGLANYAAGVKNRFVDSSVNMYAVSPSVRSGGEIVERGKSSFEAMKERVFSHKDVDVTVTKAARLTDESDGVTRLPKATEAEQEAMMKQASAEERMARESDDDPVMQEYKKHWRGIRGISDDDPAYITHQLYLDCKISKTEALDAMKGNKAPQAIIDEMAKLPPEDSYRQSSYTSTPGKYGTREVSADAIAKEFADADVFYHCHGTIGGTTALDGIADKGLMVKVSDGAKRYTYTLRGLDSTTISFGEGSDSLYLENKEMLDHWTHKDSDKVVVVGVPKDLEYASAAIRIHSPEIDAYGMFYQGNSETGYYMRPEFIKGYYDAKTQSFIPNENFYKNLPIKKQEQLFAQIKKEFGNQYVDKAGLLPGNNLLFPKDYLNESEINELTYRLCRKEYESRGENLSKAGYTKAEARAAKATEVERERLLKDIDDDFVDLNANNIDDSFDDWEIGDWF